MQKRRQLKFMNIENDCVNKYQSGELRLMRAMIMRGFQDLRGEDKKLRESSRLWFLGERKSVLPFKEVCCFLDIDMDSFVRKLGKYLSEDANVLKK